MNVDKTRIMTSTKGESHVDRLHRRNRPGDRVLAAKLDDAINEFSRKKKAGGGSEKHEEVNGLRVLGVPVGSKA